MSKGSPCRGWFAAFLAVALAARCGPALAGPPFVTDDPEPVDYRHFEINTALQGVDRDHGRSGALPGLDINYGLAPEVQAHLGLALPFDQAPDQPLHYGYGDTELGVKWRFVDEAGDGWRPQVALYPAVELPTGSAGRGLGSGYSRAFLPLWLQKSFGAWTIDGGGGYWLNRHGDNRDYWMGGLLLQRRVADDLSLGGEVFGQGRDSDGDRISAGFNLGGTFDIDDTSHILLSAGSGLRDADATDTVSYYAGYQLTF